MNQLIARSELRAPRPLVSDGRASDNIVYYPWSIRLLAVPSLRYSLGRDMRGRN